MVLAVDAIVSWVAANVLGITLEYFCGCGNLNNYLGVYPNSVICTSKANLWTGS